MILFFFTFLSFGDEDDGVEVRASVSIKSEKIRPIERTDGKQVARGHRRDLANFLNRQRG
jgi:hypothetical protein